MKKFLIILLGVIFIVGSGISVASYYDDSLGPAHPVKKAEPKEEEPKGAQCPETTYTDQKLCATCHEMRKEDGKWAWLIKPQKGKTPKRLFRYPHYIKLVNGVAEGYYEFDAVSISLFNVFSSYIYELNLKKVTINIYSGGGSLFDGIAIASEIIRMQASGITVITQVHSIAASAAMVVFLASDVRLINNYGILMWHELKGVDWPKWVTPSDKEDEARVYRLIQDNVNRYIADRIKGIDKDEVDKLVHRIEWWMTGEEAVELGIATGYIK